MVPLIIEHGRLLVDRIEYRFSAGAGTVVCVGRVARAVNCGAIEATVFELTADEVEEAAALSHKHEVKPCATSLTATTAVVPLLMYWDATGNLAG